jgi:peroxiredoxin
LRSTLSLSAVAERQRCRLSAIRITCSRRPTPRFWALAAIPFASVGAFEEKLSTGFPLLSDFPKKQTGSDYGTHNEATGVHRRMTVVLDIERVVRGIIYAENGDHAAHPVKALEILAEVNASL